MTQRRATEDLLICARLGELGEGELRRLDVALRASRELELLYDAGREFDAQADLLPGDEARMSALVKGALGELDREHAFGSKPRWANRTRSAVSFVAASFAFGVVASVAFANAWQFAEQRHWFAASSNTAATPSTLVRRVKREPAASPAVGTASANAEAVPPRAVSAARVPALLPAPSAPQPGASVQNPEALFARANEARREGRTQAAIELYQRLESEFPGSVEAQDAQVLIGNLRLAQRAPLAALDQFESYGSGALSAEALWGSAQALRKLNSPQELSALQRLLREYPDSPYAQAARVRLRQLPAPSE